MKRPAPRTSFKSVRNRSSVARFFSYGPLQFFGDGFIPPSARIARQRLVERGRMPELGDDLGQNAIRDRFAVGDHAVEVENQCTHGFNSMQDVGVAGLIGGRPAKSTCVTEARETLSVAACIDGSGARSFGGC